MLGQSVTKDLQEDKEHRVTKDQQDQPDLPVQQDLQDLQDQQETKVELVVQVDKDQKGIEETKGE
jgi:hypothetical protein